MKQKAVILGCGMVGATIARDLATDDQFEVTVADVSADNLARVSGVTNVTIRVADLSTPQAVADVIQEADVVLGAMPSRLGRMVLQTVIEAGKSFSDISFMIEDAREFDGLAQRKGVTAVVDCGVAPGLANLIIGHCYATLDRTDRIAYYVGGLPKSPAWPYFYKAPFAPSDVIEEYTRPARLRVDGRNVVRPALSEAERICFEGIGELEAFNTDGLRSLLDTIDCPNMVEKTLRWPGHAELMAIFRETGFFSKEEIDVRGTRVRPLDVTAKLLFPMWTYKPGEEEFTILRVVVEGQERGEQVRLIYELYDVYDAQSDQTSMARTTGFPCAIVGRMLARGEITQNGVLPPELLGKHPGMLERITEELSRRGVHIQHRRELL